MGSKIETKSAKGKVHSLYVLLITHQRGIRNLCKKRALYFLFPITIWTHGLPHASLITLFLAMYLFGNDIVG